jgi:hypothetical protein
VTELLTIDLRNAQAGISELYTDLDRVKRALAAEGYRDEVDKYASMNELAGANTLPSSIGFFYDHPGMIRSHTHICYPLIHLHAAQVV